MITDNVFQKRALRLQKDEDPIAFLPTSLGSATVGTWEMYFDGSDVELDLSGEDIFGAHVHANGDIYLTTSKGSFTVTGVTGEDEDVFICRPISVGVNTACNYQPLYFDGSVWGLADEVLDAIGLP